MNFLPYPFKYGEKAKKEQEVINLTQSNNLKIDHKYKYHCLCVSKNLAIYDYLWSQSQWMRE